MQIPFFKYQGNGNDFIVIDGLSIGMQDSDFPEAWVNQICNRRFGIGADGFIVVQKQASTFEIVYRNSDGSPSSLCGNGSRCFIDFICTHLNAPQSGEFLAVDGLHRYTWRNSDQIQIEMFAKAAPQYLENGDCTVFTGSPHYMHFENSVFELRDFIPSAKQIRHSPAFDLEGINVNFISEISPQHLQMRTFERGVEDETLACGTGMTAAAIAQVFRLKLAQNPRIQVDMPGGSCTFQFDGYAIQDSIPIWKTIWMIGPSKHVFTGTIHLPQL